MADDAVEQFIGITGASQEEAAFYLETAHGDVAGAVDQFFAASTGEAVEDETAPAAAELPRPQDPPPASTSAPQSTGRAARPSRRAAPSGKIRSLADLNSRDSDEDSDEMNEYYAGGEKSGQVVRGPNRGAKEDEVEGLFNRARQAGAEEGNPADLQPAARGSSAFSGTARTLTGDAPTQAPTAPQPSGPPQPVVHTITFYANNVFTVDDGPPRRMDDPANRAFLGSISAGECPAELAVPGSLIPINVNLVRAQGDYQEPERPRYVAFQGTGRTLTDGPAAPEASVSATSAAAPSMRTEWAGVDESSPATSIQLRLLDGSRLIARFNTSHTVADIRKFLAASRPDLGQSYRLMTAFPQQQLSDDSATIAAAGLENAVIMQKQ